MNFGHGEVAEHEPHAPAEIQLHPVGDRMASAQCGHSWSLYSTSVIGADSGPRTMITLVIGVLKLAMAIGLICEFFQGR
jgi:hypothetical protein